MRSRDLAAFAGLVVLLALPAPAQDRVGEVQELAPGVYFHQGDSTQGHCNQGWVEFEDFVLVVDGNFPSGAEVVIAKIRARTDKPIRFAFDTHHHGDHMYGNRVWAEAGAIPVAHEGVIEEARRYETGFFGGEPGRWESAAEQREDVRDSALMLPTIRYPDRLVFDDGTRRVELLHFGVSHTHGDGWAWLPEERILFSGDACVNGPHNYVGDGDTREWVETLARAQELDPRIVGVGHGPLAEGSVLGDQKAFFEALHRVVGAEREKGRSAAEVEAAIESLRAQVLADQRIARYVGAGFGAQVEKVWTELGGEPFAASRLDEHRERHARHHGWTATAREEDRR